MISILKYTLHVDHLLLRELQQTARQLAWAHGKFQLETASGCNYPFQSVKLCSAAKPIVLHACAAGTYEALAVRNPPQAPPAHQPCCAHAPAPAQWANPGRRPITRSTILAISTAITISTPNSSCRAISTGASSEDSCTNNDTVSSSSDVTSSSNTSSELLCPALENRLQQLAARYRQLEAALAGEGGGPAVGSLRDVGREYSRLRPQVEAYEQLRSVRKELSDLQELLADADSQVRAMAAEEAEPLRQQSAALTRQLLLALLPTDPRAGRPALLELRAGAGGLEAALFCGELLGMYQRLALSRGWLWQVLELSQGDVGGVRHAVVAVSEPGGDGGGSDAGPDGVYGILSLESGVHRVQRVPVTDTQGRVHTSTASIVVLPQADEVDVRLRDADLRIETMRASGAGGQHVNVTDSAVRITHIPTGLVVACQNERSQVQNRMAALKVLRSRLYDMEAQKRAKEVDEQRAAQVASAERNERIRTYNYPQDRVTDHRAHVSVHDLQGVLGGGEGLTRLMDEVREARQEAALKRLVENEGRGLE